MNITGLLVLILAAVLWYLYHKLFTVVYTNALAGILREVVICLVLSVVILTVVFNALGIEVNSKKKETNQPSAQEQTDPIRDFLPWSASSQEPPVQQELPVADFYGDFVNTSLLDGNIFQTWLTIEQSGSSNDELHILGSSYAMGIFDSYVLDMTIPVPEGNTFTCYDELNGVTLTITLHPEDHSLEVMQQPAISRFGTPYTGSYIDKLTYRSRPEFDTAALRIELAWNLKQELAIEDGTIIETANGASYVYYDEECAYILSNNSVEYRCNATESNGSASITMARNDAMYEPQNYYAKISGYNSNGTLCGTIQGYLTTMLNDSFGIYSETGYLSITQGEGCFYVVEYGTFISPDIVFTGTHYR